MRQRDLAVAAGVSAATASRAERGHVDSLSLRTLRSLFSALEARVEIDPKWRGAEIDRVVDASHATLVATAAAALRGLGWMTYPEVTFSVYGERGSIDLLALHRVRRAAVMLEAKTEIASAEETQRRMDVKARLLPGIANEREGWRPRNVARILLIGEGRTNRGRVARLEALFADSLPARNVAVRRWLREPVGPLAGIWFLPVLHAQNIVRGTGGKSRVRVARGAAEPRPSGANEHESG